jgi:Predicted hydrolases or acyltransferases (alpha/beta hydrolase superfamily)
MQKYLTANGLSLAYEEFGNPKHPAILLVMGLGTQMIAWPVAFCENLAKEGFRVIRFDNRDIGLSEKIDVKRSVSLPVITIKQKLGFAISVPYSLHDMALDAVGVLDALDIEAAHWVGASMGGMIAQLAAANHPSKVLSLTSIMSSSGNPTLKGPSLNVIRLLLKSPNRNSEEQYLADSLAKWAVLGSPDYPPTKEALTERILENLHRSYYPKGYVHQMAAIIDNGDRRPLLRKIRVPSLIIHGQADVLIPVEGGIDTAKNIKGSTLKLIQGMGHDLPRELLPKFIRYICQHIEQNTSQAQEPQTQYAKAVNT